MSEKIDKVVKELKSIAGGKNINDFNSATVRNKVKSEMVRILYYMAQNFEGPHPWGIASRLMPPRSLPLPLKDKNAGKHTREVLEKLINDSKWDSRIRQLLREAKDNLSKVPKSK